jgi:hypothetical protein
MVTRFGDCDLLRIADRRLRIPGQPAERDEGLENLAIIRVDAQGLLQKSWLPRGAPASARASHPSPGRTQCLPLVIHIDGRADCFQQGARRFSSHSPMHPRAIGVRMSRVRTDM